MFQLSLKKHNKRLEGHGPITKTTFVVVAVDLTLQYVLAIISRLF